VTTPDRHSDLDVKAFSAYLDRTRWFGGKGRPYVVSDVRTLGELRDGPPLVVIHLVELTYSDSEGGTELYQVPLALYQDPEHRLDHAFVGWWEDPDYGWVHAYDALHDRDAMALWQRAFNAADRGELAVDGLRFHRLPGHELDLEAHSTLFSGEQSNSSVAFGEDALMKVFRKVTPGVNPDIAVHEVLTRAGSPHVAALYGWLDVQAVSVDGEETVLQLAMLQQFLRTASDGWDLALVSVRSLYADPEVRAQDSGGDFAGESSRLGEALRDVHRDLREHFPAETRPGAAADELAATMNARLDAALAVVPGLEEHAKGLRVAFDEVAELGGLDVQQVHGDLHLGQTLRTSQGWKIVDFEGEPAKHLAERQLPDSPWRDVAGMLRSFDYAAHVVERALGTADADAELIRTRAEEWSERNKNHFLFAYAGGALTPEQQVLLNAYVADKAVYETVYETRNRPSWVTIPLQAVARIGAA
jgi:maltokinase